MMEKPNEWTPERLRALSRYLKDDFPQLDCEEGALRWAADEIERKDIRIKALEQWSDGVAKTCVKLDAENERRRMEIVRLRAAAAHVLEMTTPIPDMVSVYVVSAAIADLRAAMGESDE